VSSALAPRASARRAPEEDAAVGDSLWSEETVRLQLTVWEQQL